jgi:hypothetical protein
MLFWTLIGSCTARCQDHETALKELAVKFQAIADEEAKKATGYDITGQLGTIHNDWGLIEARCASLAYFLDKREIYKRLIVISAPQIINGRNAKTLFDLALYIRSLENRAYAVKSVVNLSQSERVEMWNLDCVGKLNIGNSHTVRSLSSIALFSVKGDSLFILGNIERGFFERFRKVLKENPNIKNIYVGSGGGSVRDAMMSGLLIRKLELTTTLYTDCYSSCPLLFMGGSKRLVWSPYPRFGFHQVSSDGQEISREHIAYKVIGQYAYKMGVNGQQIVALMYQATPLQMKYQDVSQLCATGITTWVQRMC